MCLDCAKRADAEARAAAGYYPNTTSLLVPALLSAAGPSSIAASREGTPDVEECREENSGKEEEEV